MYSGRLCSDSLLGIFPNWLQLHNASLLVDDIEDGSKLRRGIPVAHDIYGVPTTINTANYIYFMALERFAYSRSIHDLGFATSAILRSKNCHMFYIWHPCRCHMLGSPRAMNVFVLELLNLHRGQGQDILWRDQLRCPTEAQYRAMVLDKVLVVSASTSMPMIVFILFVASASCSTSRSWLIAGVSNAVPDGWAISPCRGPHASSG